MLPFEFDNWDKEIKLNIWDYLNIGLYQYKVLDIKKSRVSCERIGLVN